jgi:hypothetical protein
MRMNTHMSTVILCEKQRITLKNRNAPLTMPPSRCFDDAITQQPNNVSAKNGY